MNIIGLDLAGITGVAVINEREELIYIKEYSLKGIEEERYEQLYNYLISIFKQYQPTFIAVEELVSFRSGNTTRILSGYRAISGLAAWQYNQCSINKSRPTGVRKIVLGELNKGKASEKKKLIREILSKKYCIELTENEADALAVALALAKEIKNKPGN